jgi:hypothetical protein
MKKSILSGAAALACAAALSACGGSDNGQLQLAVQLVGVTKPGMSISNKGGPLLPVTAGTAFLFPDLVEYDSDYDITITGKPTNTDSCTVLNGKGNTGSYSPNNIAITCVITTFNLGGSVNGLTGGDLVINNGAQRVTIPKNATTFSMSTPTTEFPRTGQLPEGALYGLTILQQPASGTCVIANPNGTMPAASVSSIVINCS